MVSEPIKIYQNNEPIFLRGQGIPIWSPSGQHIAFISDDKLCIFYLDSFTLFCTPKVFSLLPSGGLAWSPDGKRLASADERGISIFNNDGKQMRFLIEGYSPVWSPDSQKIAFLSAGKVFVMSASGPPAQYISDSWGAGGITWSPNSQWITFPDGDGQISIADSTGSKIRRISDMAWWTWGEGPAWSPDGKQIAFYQTSDFCRIFVVDIYGSNPRYLANGEYPTWSFNSSRILFRSHRQDNNGLKRIYIMNADGTNIHQISEGLYPAWSPNGKQILFTRDLNLSIYILNV